MQAHTAVVINKGSQLVLVVFCPVRVCQGLQNQGLANNCRARRLRATKGQATRAFSYCSSDVAWKGKRGQEYEGQGRHERRIGDERRRENTGKERCREEEPRVARRHKRELQVREWYIKRWKRGERGQEKDERVEKI